MVPTGGSLQYLDKKPVYLALAELGRAVKIIFLCRYLYNERVRQEIQEWLTCRRELEQCQ